MESTIIIANAVGLLAFGVGKGAYAFKQDVYLKLFIALSLLLYATQYFLLGASAAGMILILAAARFFVSAYIKHIAVCVGFCLGFIALGYWQANSWWDVIPAGVAVMITVSSFYLQGLRLRLSFLVSSCLWAVYGIQAGAYLAVCMDIIGMTINIIFMVKHYGRDMMMQFKCRFLPRTQTSVFVNSA